MQSVFYVLKRVGIERPSFDEGAEDEEEIVQMIVEEHDFESSELSSPSQRRMPEQAQPASRRWLQKNGPTGPELPGRESGITTTTSNSTTSPVSPNRK